MTIEALQQRWPDWRAYPALGLVVCTVQTLVFALLTIVYIQLAVAHEEH